MKTSILSRVVRVADNLFRDPTTSRYYGRKTVAGRPKLKSFETTDRAIASGRLAAWLRELEENAPSVDADFETILRNFLVTREGKKPATQQTERGIAATLRGGFQRALIVKEIKSPAAVAGMRVEARLIRPSDLLIWLNFENDERKWGFEYYNRCRFFLSQLFALAVTDGILSAQTNPFDAKLIKKRKRDGKTVRRIPTIAQFEAIISDVRSQRDNSRREESARFLAAEGLLGVGQAEVSTMRRDDINLSTDRISFRRMKTTRPFTVPIYAWARKLVVELLAQPSHIDGKIFHMRDGKKALTRACKRLHLPHFTQRGLRAMCIKRLYDAGVDVKQISKWQGHSDGGRLIMNTYTEVFGDGDAAAENANLELVRAANVEKIAA